MPLDNFDMRRRGLPAYRLEIAVRRASIPREREKPRPEEIELV
jgi:hypothetical protein